MSIKPVSISDKDLLGQCELVRDKLKAKYTCHNDIFPTVELPSYELNERNFFKQVDRFGFRYIRSCQHYVKNEPLMIACLAAEEQLIAKGMIKGEDSALFAKAESGRIECQPLSLLASRELEHLNPTCINLETADEDIENRRGNAHVFVLVGIPHDEIVKTANRCKSKILPTLDKLKKGVILDLALNCVCLVSEYKNKAPSLLKYIKTHRTEIIFDPICVTPGSTDAPFKNAKLVYALALDLLPQFQMHNPQIVLFRELTCEYLHKTALPDLISVVEARFPQAKWRAKVDPASVDWTLWTKGAPKLLEPIGEQLKAIGAKASASKVKDKEEYGIVFRDPDPLLLRVLFATEQLFGEATGKIAEILTRYAEK